MPTLIMKERVERPYSKAGFKGRDEKRFFLLKTVLMFPSFKKS